MQKMACMTLNHTFLLFYSDLFLPSLLKSGGLFTHLMPSIADRVLIFTSTH